MRKAFVIAIVFAMVIGLMGCGNYTEDRNIENVGIPQHVSHIEFWNGGSKIAEANNASVKILVQSNSSVVSFSAKGNQVQFYVYEVTTSQGTVYIVDSESLAIVFTK